MVNNRTGKKLNELKCYLRQGDTVNVIRFFNNQSDETLKDIWKNKPPYDPINSNDNELHTLINNIFAKTIETKTTYKHNNSETYIILILAIIIITLILLIIINSDKLNRLWLYFILSLAILIVIIKYRGYSLKEETESYLLCGSRKIRVEKS